jgi:FkbM family methyltransferase
MEIGPSHMLKSAFKVEIVFGADGNSESFTKGGWCLSEPNYTFNAGHEATLTVPKPFDADKYELSLDVWPFVIPDRLPVQHLDVIIHETRVLAAAIDSHERQTLRCEIPADLVAGHESLDITLLFPDAAPPVSVTDNSPDTRVVAFAFFCIRLSGRLVDDARAGDVEQNHPDAVMPRSPERLVLVDVGAMGGVQAKWLPYLDSITPILFEPNPEEAAALRANFTYATVVEAALGNVVGRRNLVITENPTCISMRSPNQEFLAAYTIHPHLRVKGTQEVECTRYDILHRKGIVPAPDAIKLDVQGCEYEVLIGFGALLQDCLGIELEAHFYPLYRDQHLLHEIIALLGDYGFVLRKLDQNKMDHFDGDLVEVDAFFTKPLSVVRSYDQIQRRKFDLLTTVWQLAQ